MERIISCILGSILILLVIAVKPEVLQAAWQENTGSAMTRIVSDNEQTPAPTVIATKTSTPTGSSGSGGSLVEDDDVIAYPLPASTNVTFVYKADGSGDVTLIVYNTNFRIVKELTDTTSTGEGTILWNVSDIAPGLYFYRVRIGNKLLAMKRLVIAR